jgi:hypothetical protein
LASAAEDSVFRIFCCLLFGVIIERFGRFTDPWWGEAPE